MAKPSHHRESHRRKTYDRGVDAETRVARALRAVGWTILAQRMRTAAGEIDVIALDADTLVFMEVKHRATLVDAAYAISQRQRMRILAAAEIWLGENGAHADRPMRFDVVLLAPNGQSRHIRQAFDASAP